MRSIVICDTGNDDNITSQHLYSIHIQPNNSFIMAALRNMGAIIFLSCNFYLLSIFFFSSPNLCGRRLDVYHTSTHGVALV